MLTNKLFRLCIVKQNFFTSKISFNQSYRHKVHLQLQFWKRSIFLTKFATLSQQLTKFDMEVTVHERAWRNVSL